MEQGDKGVGEAQEVPELAAKLPAQIRELIEAGCSWEAILTLMERCGGLPIQIPLAPHAEHILVKRCGIEVARELSRLTGGLRIEVPRGTHVKLAIRNMTICKEYDAGASVAALVDKYGIATRTIRKILKG